MGRKLLNSTQRYPQPINPESAKVIKLKFSPQAKSTAQGFYLEALRESSLTIGTGPAGAGKTFLAMAVAVEKLLSNEIQKIVLTRPMVQSGPGIGFLPGDSDQKIAPYMRPLLDALEDLVGVTMAKKLIDSGKIEFAPLAFFRGRTFRNSAVLLDEAQNSTIEEMKLFITRIGEGSFFIVNGDTTQSDLKGLPENGLDWVVRKLRGRSSKISVIEFTQQDIQRSEILKTILAHIEAPDEIVYKRKAA